MTKSVHNKKYADFLSLLIGARRDAGLTQAEIANRLGRPQSYVSKYENGERRLDVIEFLEVAAAVEKDPIRIIRKLL